MMCDITVFNWLTENNLVRGGHYLVEVASRSDRVDVLNWWLCNKDTFVLPYQSQFLFDDITHFSDEVLNWWFSSGLIVDVSLSSIISVNQLSKLCKYIGRIPIIKNLILGSCNEIRYFREFHIDQESKTILKLLESNKIDYLKINEKITKNGENYLLTFLKINNSVRNLDLELRVDDCDKLIELTSYLENDCSLIELHIYLEPLSHYDETIVYRSIVNAINSNYTILTCCVTGFFRKCSCCRDHTRDIDTTLGQILDRNNDIYANKRFAKTKAITQQ